MPSKHKTKNVQELVFEEAMRLHEVKPDHELLKYAFGSSDKSVREAFISRFGNPSISKQDQLLAPAPMYTFTMYYLALREACKDPEKPIVVVHCGIAISEDEIPY